MIYLSLYLDAGISDWAVKFLLMAIQFSIKRSLSCYNPRGTEKKLLMHEAGRGKMIFGDCIALCSVLASFEALLRDSLLSATKATPLLWKQLCLPSVQNRYHAAPLLGWTGLLVSRKDVSYSQKTGRERKRKKEKNQNLQEMSRPHSVNYLIVAFSL